MACLGHLTYPCHTCQLDSQLLGAVSTLLNLTLLSTLFNSRTSMEYTAIGPRVRSNRNSREVGKAF